MIYCGHRSGLDWEWALTRSSPAPAEVTRYATPLPHGDLNEHWVVRAVLAEE